MAPRRMLAAILKPSLKDLSGSSTGYAVVQIGTTASICLVAVNDAMIIAIRDSRESGLIRFKKKKIQITSKPKLPVKTLYPKFVPIVPYFHQSEARE